MQSKTRLSGLCFKDGASNLSLFSKSSAFASLLDVRSASDFLFSFLSGTFSLKTRRRLFPKALSDFVSPLLCKHVLCLPDVPVHPEGREI